MVGLAPATLTAQEEDLDSQRERLEEINEEKAALQQELSEMRQGERLAKNELEEIDRELTTISSRMERTTAELERKKAQVEMLNQSHTKAMADLEKSQAMFEARLVEWYKSGAGTILSSVITCGDLSDFSFAMSYTEAVIENDHKTIKFIREQQGKIYEERRILDEGIAECEKLIADMRREENRYEDLRARRYSRLAEIAGDVNETEAALREMEAASYEIAMLLQVSKYTGTVGALIKPIDYPIGSGFGMRMHPIFHRVRMHTGVDIGVAKWPGAMC